MRAALLVLVASSALLASAEINVDKDYPRFIQFPDGEGRLHDVDLQQLPDMTVVTEVERNPANNLYILFTRCNPTAGQTLIMNNAASIRNSNFNPNLPTKVIAHGWLSNQHKPRHQGCCDLASSFPNEYHEFLHALEGMLSRLWGMDPTLKCLLRKGYSGECYINQPDCSDVNIIVLDWRRLAISTYTTAVRGVPAVGRGLGQFINFVCQTTGANVNNFHLIGFSLGGHLVGNAGRELGGRAARITSLDPAGPLWVYNSNKVTANDAQYVEGIHTDGGLNGLGIGSAIGNVDFFPNGGTNQPGCLTGVCDHNRSWELFAATVTYNHLIGNQCSSNLQITLNNCRGSQLHMGNSDLRKSGSGLYRVNTERRYPF